MAPRPAADSSRRSSAARDSILTAARSLVLRDGYAKLTIEGIAAAAGVGKQTIYRWWSSKGAVVFEAFLALNRNASGAMKLPDTGDLERDLKTVLRATVKELRDPSFDAAFRAMSAEIQHDLELAQQLVRILLAPQMQAAVERLESAQRVKQVRKGIDLYVASELLFGPVFHRWLLRTERLDRQFADKVVALTCQALRPGSRA